MSVVHFSCFLLFFSHRLFLLSVHSLIKMSHVSKTGNHPKSIY